jgi:hypothetical protein
MVLYPTLAETRFMAYQSIVHGSNGISRALITIRAQFRPRHRVDREALG